MRKSIAFFMGSLVVLNPFQGIAAGPKEVAQKVVSQYQMKARQDAVAMVNEDFASALTQIMSNVGAQYLTAPTAQVYYGKMRELADKVSYVMSGLDAEDTVSDLFVQKVWDDYRDAVRDRFKLSFEIQKNIYDQSHVIDATTEAISKFENVCESGRSEVGLKYQVDLLPNTPNADFSFFVEYKFGKDGGMSRVSGNSSNSTGKDKDRQTVQAGLYTAASVSSGIALGGGTGATVAAATMAAPWLVGGAVAYAAIAHFNAVEEQAQLQLELSDANVMMLKEIATDRDIAYYYRQACRDLLPLTALLRKHLNGLRGSEAERAELMKEVIRHKETLDIYAHDSIENAKNLEILRLAHLIRSKKCVEIGHPNISEAVCYKNIERFVLVGLPDITLPVDQNLINEIITPLESKAEEFAKKYPREKRAELLAAQVTLILGPHWEVTQKSLNQLSFDSLDILMSSLFERLQLVLAELRAQKNASWNRSGDPIFEEIEIQSDFEKLKKRHRELVAAGVKVVFDRMDRQQFQKSVEEYLSKARLFGTQRRSNKQVRDYINSVQSLVRIYKKL